MIFGPHEKVLEIGGGEHPMFRPNLDIRQLPTVDIVCDLHSKFPIEDHSFDGVYCSYLLEHISWRKVKEFIKEVKRILKPGGKVFFMTANLLEQCKKFIESQTDDEVCAIFGGQDFGEEWRANAHYCGFSPQSVKKMFLECGFDGVEIQEHPNCKTDMIIVAHLLKDNACWASFTPVMMDPNYLIVTKQIFDLETHIYLNCKIPLNDSIHLTRRFEYPWVTMNISANVKSILDIGGGSSWSYFQSTITPDFTILDMDPAIEERTNLIKKCTNQFNNIKSITCNWLENKLPDNMVDCTCSISTIEHMGEGTLGKAISEMKRVTKPNGTIIFTMDVDVQGNPSIPFEYAKQELKKIGVELPEPNKDCILASIDDRGTIGVICVAMKNVK